MTTSINIETILKRDRAIVLTGLAVITTLSWIYMFYLAWQMKGMNSNMAMPMMQSWNTIDFLLMFIMWAVMMVAMMVPSAAPMVLIFASVNRKRRDKDAPYVPTVVFVLGYLVVWSVFSIAATAAQWGLHEAALLSPMMSSSTPVLGGLLLITAGVFQWTPMKDACLSHCKSPLGFIMTHWKEGQWGAFFMGLHHGAYCVGCCWALMALLFVNGVMNLLWIAVLAALVLIEKVIHKTSWFPRVTGGLLVAWGIFILVIAFSE
jgi:predicted metal-binding membrane protein